MSLTTCHNCARIIDTDDEPECYGPDDLARCAGCRVEQLATLSDWLHEEIATARESVIESNQWPNSYGAGCDWGRLNTLREVRRLIGDLDLPLQPTTEST